MKTLGLIGGLSWYSTAVYYRLINERVASRLGAEHSARLILYSVEFNDFRVLQARNDWSGVEGLLVDIAGRLLGAGAELLVMCTNTPHAVADRMRERIGMPLLHIAEETAKAIEQRGMDRVGLLGTRFTMEGSFFTSKLAERGITTVVPEESERAFVHRCIFEELTQGQLLESTRRKLVEVMHSLAERGAQGVVLGCTELALLIDAESGPFEVFDTTRIHAWAAADWALPEGRRLAPPESTHAQTHDLDR
jgi:aspartate racemase